MKDERDRQYGKLLTSGELTDKEWLVLKLRETEKRLKAAEEALRWCEDYADFTKSLIQDYFKRYA